MSENTFKIIEFTVDELREISRDIARLSAVLDKPEQAAIKEKDFEAVRTAGKALSKYWDMSKGELSAEQSVEDEDTVRVRIDQPGLSYVRRHVKSTIKSLEEKILPGYKRRLKGPADKKKYQPYIKKGEQRLELYKRMSEALK